MSSLLSPRLVGRDRELTNIAAVLNGGRPVAAVTVVGDAGMGKSALLRAATASGDRVVLEGAARRGSAPLGALSEIAVAAVVAGADARHPSLDALRSGLAPLLGVASASDEINSAAMAPLMVEALLALTATLAEEVVCVLDDLHWADPVTVSVCERLCARARGRRGLSLLMATRPGSNADSAFRRLAAGRLVELLELEALGRDEVTEMVSACLGGHGPPELIGLLDVCGGRPFFIEEYLSAAVHSGVLRGAPGGWVIGADPEVPVPGTVLDALARRADDLAPTTRRLLIAAAALGDGVPAGAVAAAAGVSDDELGAALREGSAARLLSDADDRHDHITFRHVLAADALLMSTTERERRTLAKRALEHLEASPPSGESTAATTAVVARLAQEAGDRGTAAHRRLELARTLGSQAAVGSALEQYDLALDLSTDPVLRRAARAERIQLLVLAGQLERALAELDAVDLDVREDRADRTAVAILRAQAHATDVGISRRWAAQARKLAANPRQLGHVLAVSALLEVDRGESTAAEALARDALATHDIDPITRVQALEALGRVARARSLDAAARCFRRAEAVAHDHSLQLWRARALHELATIRQLQYSDTVELETARIAAVECGATGLLASIDFHIAAVHATAFDGPAALPVARRCVDLAGVVGDPVRQAYGWMLCGFAHLVSGQRHEAAAALAESDRCNPGSVELTVLTAYLREGFARLLGGNTVDAAQSHVDAMVELAQLSEVVSPLPPWYLGPLLLTVLDHDRAAEIRALADRAELNVVVMCRPTLELAEAVDAGRRGDLATAETLAATALERWQDKPAAQGLRHLAGWLAAGPAATAGWGDPMRWLFDAEAWATSQNLPGVAGSCRAQLRDLGATPKRRRGRTPVPAGLRRLGLTSREVDVLTLLPEGLSNAVIGERLHIAPGTVKGYVENLLVKTGSPNRAALARLATDHGLTGVTGNSS